MTNMVSVQDYDCPPELYDVIYSDIRDDIPFWVAEAKAARGPVLELCCGTGRVLIPCLEAGAPVEGLDITESMLAHCRAKLAARGLKAHLESADMRDFERPGRYALITIPFNSFLHNLTQADQLATLERCHARLEPGGRLLLSIFHPQASKLAEHDGVPRVLKTIPHPAGGGTRVIDAGRCGPVEQHIWMARKAEILDATGAIIATHDMSFEMRYIWKPEMELLLAAAGFTRIEVEARTGYAVGFAPKPKVEEGDNLIWTAWRA